MGSGGCDSADDIFLWGPIVKASYFTPTSATRELSSVHRTSRMDRLGYKELGMVIGPDFEFRFSEKISSTGHFLHGVISNLHELSKT